MSGRTIDLNADLGEGFPNDKELLARVTSTSISCGAHAGDPNTMLQTLLEARRRGAMVGAHPSYPDRGKFGRRPMDLPPRYVTQMIVQQVESLASFANHLKMHIRFVKPHGALYNQAQSEESIANSVIAAVKQLWLPLVGQPGTLLETLAREKGVLYFAEGFPDRRYGKDGKLVPRTRKNAVLHDRTEIEEQVVRLVEQDVATLCIHGDDPRAVENADIVRDILYRHRIRLKSFVFDV